jgi:hypothetical protein
MDQWKHALHQVVSVWLYGRLQALTRQGKPRNMDVLMQEHHD